MTADGQLKDLYRDTVLRHSRAPHNLRRMESHQARAEGHNPLCGDHITVYLRMKGATIDDVAYEAEGCAISMASASMMTDVVAGRTPAEAGALAQAVAALLDGSPPGCELGEINALAGVRAYPARKRCAMLPWRTLEAALGGAAGTVTTESKD